MKRVFLIFIMLVGCFGVHGQARLIFVNGRIGMGSPKGAMAYWQKDSSFVDSAKVALNSSAEPFFTDVQYSLFSKAGRREKDGYEYAYEHFEDIVGGCSGPFRLVTHSMGAAFGEGIARCLLEKGLPVDVIIHFEPYQAPDIKTAGSSENILTIDYQVADDWLIHLAGKGRIAGADLFLGNYRTSAPIHKKHRYPINHASTWHGLQPSIDGFLDR